MILGVQRVIAYFTVRLNESYFNIMALACSEIWVLREQFVNEQIKHKTHLIDKKSSNPGRRGSYKTFLPMVPFKINYFH